MNTKQNQQPKNSQPSRDVRPARLQQKTGAEHAFQGYAKIQTKPGTFRMRRVGS